MNIVMQNIKWLFEKSIGHFSRRDKNLWVFGEWFGKRCCDNSLFLANYVSEYYPDIQVVWIAEENIDLSMLSSRIRKIKMDTPESKQLLMHAGVVIYNQSLSDFSRCMNLYCMGAVTINLWHGVPWKKIGIDAFSGESKVKWIYVNYILRLQRPTLYLSTSEAFTDILQSAYCIKKKNIIKAGYPRNSIFYDERLLVDARDKVLNWLENTEKYTCKSGVKIITYMPTFRDHEENVFSFEQLTDNEQLNGILIRNNAVIIQKAHFVNRSKETKDTFTAGQRIFNLDDISAAELLAASDLLITDYSSCFFDYLLLDRPIIHYIYDYDYYANKDRGLYYEKEEVVCGDAVETIDGLLKSISENLVYPEKNLLLRQKRRERFMMYETAECCKVIFEAINERLER